MCRFIPNWITPENLNLIIRIEIDYLSNERNKLTRINVPLKNVKVTHIPGRVGMKFSLKFKTFSLVSEKI